MSIYEKKFVSLDRKFDYSDVLIVPNNSNLVSRSDVDLNTSYSFKYGTSWSGTPIIASNMDSTGTFAMAAAFSSYGMLTAVHKHYTADDWNSFLANNEAIVLNNIIVSSGIADADIKKASTILDMLAAYSGRGAAGGMLMIDVANGYTATFGEKIQRIREANDRPLCIMAGNVVTPKRTEELIELGADVVKLGIGPGSVCTTRKKTGVGFPQFSCVLECAQVATELKAHVIADGGCGTPADVCKAFAAGAHFCMMGGMLSGHDQSGGDFFEEGGKKYKLFYGMSSQQAQDKHSGGVADYRASEGKCVRIPYRGDVNVTIKDILGGLRSCCTYTGAAQLGQLNELAKFIVVGNQLNEIYSKLEI